MIKKGEDFSEHIELIRKALEGTPLALAFEDLLKDYRQTKHDLGNAQQMLSIMKEMRK